MDSAPSPFITRPFQDVWIAQFFALLEKCVAVIRFKALSTLGVIFLPSLFIGGLYGLYINLLVATAPPANLAQFQGCTSFNVYGYPYSPIDAPCISILFAPDTDPNVETIMQRVATATGLTYGRDIVGVASGAAAAGFMYDNARRQVDASVIFTGDLTKGLPKGEVNYEIWYNSSLPPTYASIGLDPLFKSVGVSGRYAAVQKQVDAAIIGWLSGVTAPGTGDVPIIDVSIGAFTDYENTDAIGGAGPAQLMLLIAGATFLISGVVCGSLLIMNVITGEKGRKLVGQLRTIGLYESTYWASWLVSYIPVIIISALIAPLIGQATDIVMFTKVDYAVNFIALFLLGMATLANTMCCASCTRAQRWVNLASFFQFVSAITIATTFAGLQLFVIIYYPTVPIALSAFVALFPAFHYGKLINTILLHVFSAGTASGGGDDVSVGRALLFPGQAALLRQVGVGEDTVDWVYHAMTGIDRNGTLSSAAQYGQHALGASSGSYSAFTWADLSNTPVSLTVTIDGFQTTWTDFDPAFNLWMLLALTAGYTFLAWYLGQVMTGDLGASQPVYFILSPYYWGLARLPDHVEPGDTVARVQAQSAQEGSVKVHKVSKTFAKNTALTEVSLTMHPGQLFALLGQNGAGKTTLVNILSGLTTPTHGEAFLYGKSIRSEMNVLRDVIGICPQDDLLWEELSARAHVELFAKFRGVPPHLLDEHVNNRLSTVGLLDVAGAGVDTFSGGMKRRLSVAMSAVGDPRIIFLDEPTTGLDPLSRRKVWGMIEALKPGRVLVLTTHSMEEADALGDQVAIVASGRLRANGTPLFLKNRFGAGYQINLLTDPSRVEELRALVMSHLPEAEVVGEVGDSATDGTLLDGMGAVPMPQMAYTSPYPKVQAVAPGQAAAPSGYFAPAGFSSSLVVAPLPPKRAATGALTIALPRSMTKALPAFLRVLQDFSRDTPSVDGSASSSAPLASPDRLIKEWGLSNSTMEEVFLRLAAANKSVNAPLGMTDGGAGTEAAVPVPMPMPLAGVSGQQLRAARQQQQQTAFPPTPYGAVLSQGQGHGGAKQALVCALCELSRVEPVVLFNSKQVHVTVRDLLCGACAERDEAEIEAVREVAMQKGILDRPASGTVTERGVSVQKNVVANPLAGMAGEQVKEDLPYTPAPSPHPSPSPAHAKQVAFRGTGPSSLLPSSSSRAKRSMKGKAPGDAGYLPPVPFFDQFLAVFILRGRLQCTRMNICNLCYAVIGVILMVILGSNRPPIRLVRCPTGFYTTNDTLGLCSRSVYQVWMTDAVPRSLMNGFPNPAYDPRAETRKVESSSFSSFSFDAATGLTSDQAVHGIDASFPAPNAALLYNAYCNAHTPDGGCSMDASTGPILPDLAQSMSINDYNLQFNTITPFAPPMTSWHYSDSTDVADTSLGAFQFFNASTGAVGNSLPFRFNLASGTAAYGAKSSADIDAFVRSSQLAVASLSASMNGTCGQDDFGVFGGLVQGYIGYQIDDSTAASNWLTNNLPSIGVGVRRARVDATGPTKDVSLHYDLRMWALGSFGSGDGYSPQRANSYTWTSVFSSTFVSCIAGGLLYLQPDQPWANYGENGGKVLPMPAQASMTTLHNAFLRTVGNTSTGTLISSDPYIHTAYVLYPSVTWIAAVGGSGAGGFAFASLVWPLFTMFMLPSVTYSIAHEKNSKLWAAMTMAGMRQGPYFAATYAFSAMMVIVLGCIYFGTGYLAGAAVFKNTSWTLFVALFLTLAHTQAGIGLFLGSIIQNARTATMLCYMIVVVVPLTNFLVTQFVTPWPAELTWVPFMAYARASTIMISYGGAAVENGSELQEALLISFMHGCLGLLAGMYLHAVVPGPESTGATKSPLYPIVEASRLAHTVIQWVRVHAGYPVVPLSPSSSVGEEVQSSNVFRDVTRAERVKGMNASVAVAMEAGESGKGMDEEVEIEAHRISDSTSNTAAILVDGLLKEYAARAPSKEGETAGLMGMGLVRHYAAQIVSNVIHGGKPSIKRAVDGLNLRVDFGEVLGLLGPNGAGKTTTISCLTGHSSVTGGEAYVGGYDITTQLSSVWNALGVCPQFDTVWDDLSVEQTLSFYARVKGLRFGARADSTAAKGSPWSSARLRAVVQQAAEKVELDGNAFRQAAKGLSGGMRRRLSIAIALIGSPSIVFLDEPTTGLDPETRRQIHRIVAAERGAGRAMVITTHSMEEADALCSRIAIMAAGRLQAIGNQLRLKHVYGDGYRLSLTLAVPPGASSSPEGRAYLDSVADGVHAFVLAAVHPAAKMHNRVGTSVIYLLPREGIDVASVFGTLEAAKAATATAARTGVPPPGPHIALITEFGVSQTTLEDVFVRVVETSSGDTHLNA